MSQNPLLNTGMGNAADQDHNISFHRSSGQFRGRPQRLWSVRQCPNIRHLLNLFLHTHHETGYAEGDAGEVHGVLLHEREPHDEAVVRPDLRLDHRVLRRAVSQVRLAAARRNLQEKRR